MIERVAISATLSWTWQNLNDTSLPGLQPPQVPIHELLTLQNHNLCRHQMNSKSDWRLTELNNSGSRIKIWEVMFSFFYFSFIAPSSFSSLQKPPKACFIVRKLKVTTMELDMLNVHSVASTCVSEVWAEVLTFLLTPDMENVLEHRCRSNACVEMRVYSVLTVSCRWPTPASRTMKASLACITPSAEGITMWWTSWFVLELTSVRQTAMAGKHLPFLCHPHPPSYLMMHLSLVSPNPAGRRCTAQPLVMTVSCVSFWWGMELLSWPWRRAMAPPPPRNVILTLSALRSARASWGVRRLLPHLQQWAEHTLRNHAVNWQKTTETLITA